MQESDRAACAQSTDGSIRGAERVLGDGRNEANRIREIPVIEATVKVRANNDFGAALYALKSGQKVVRAGWNGKGMWLELQRPDKLSRMTLPYVYLNYPGDSAYTPGARVPWLASQTDMLAEDWAILP